MTRETSRQAIQSARADGTATERQHEALRALIALREATGQELDRHAARPGLWKRLSELKRAGLATECGVRRCAVTGMLALVWRVRRADEPPPATAAPKRRRWFGVIAEGGTILRALDTPAEAFAVAAEFGGHVEVVELREARKFST